MNYCTECGKILPDKGSCPVPGHAGKYYTNDELTEITDLIDNLTLEDKSYGF